MTLAAFLLIGFVVGWVMADLLRDETRGHTAPGVGDSQSAPPFPSHRSPSSGMAAESSRISFYPQSLDAWRD